ncbi:MAG: class I SAM-dependent methyltransferase [Pseudomonadota bacterium]
MVRGPKGAVTADDSRRDRSVLRGSAGGTAACGRAVTARVRADEGNRASVRPARAGHASRRRRRGRCLFAVVGRGGYTVHLVDPVRRLVEEAQRGSAASPNPIATYRVGDARKLAFGDGIADGVLLLGPLYHLTEAAERLRALREAHRSG